MGEYKHWLAGSSLQDIGQSKDGDGSGGCQVFIVGDVFRCSVVVAVIILHKFCTTLPIIISISPLLHNLTGTTTKTCLDAGISL